MGALETALRARRHEGGHAFVPYVTGGFPGVDAGLLRQIQDAGADAIEVGFPCSDPVMDGGVIQEASRRSLEDGSTPSRVLDTIAEAALEVPVAVMTYVNPVIRVGIGAFLDRAADAGVSGVVLPDVPVDESEELCRLAAERQIDAAGGDAVDAAFVRLAELGARRLQHDE